MEIKMDKELKERLFTHISEVKCNDKAPGPDIAICSKCGWKGPISECQCGLIDLCPKCKDGGCIDYYDMSPERFAEYEAWIEKRKRIE
jgi:hypothetical protein